MFVWLEAACHAGPPLQLCSRSTTAHAMFTPLLSAFYHISYPSSEMSASWRSWHHIFVHQIPESLLQCGHLASGLDCWLLQIAWSHSCRNCSKLHSITRAGTAEAESTQKKGYKLPRAPMTNSDLTRLINSDEVQSVVRPKKTVSLLLL